VEGCEEASRVVYVDLNVVRSNIRFVILLGTVALRIGGKLAPEMVSFTDLLVTSKI
jgi:hypothetical protein